MFVSIDYPNDVSFPEEIKDNILKISELSSNSTESEWMECLSSIDNYDGYICNVQTEEEKSPFPSCIWTFIHHAAYHNAPLSIIQKIKANNFVLSLKDGEGQLAVDHVSSNASEEYKDLLKPKYKMNISAEKLKNIEKIFHELIYSRTELCTEILIKKHHLILPAISILLEPHVDITYFYWEIPQMHGGFSMEFEWNEDKTDVTGLVTNSYNRIFGGSGKTHLCTEKEAVLLREGYIN